MAKAGTVAVLLPGAFYALRETKLPPVEALRRHHVPIAFASDCNPGTSPARSLLLMLSMATTLFRLTPEEALAGVIYPVVVDDWGLDLYVQKGFSSASYLYTAAETIRETGKPTRRWRGIWESMRAPRATGAELAMECDVLKRSLAPWVEDAMKR